MRRTKQTGNDTTVQDIKKKKSLQCFLKALRMKQNHLYIKHKVIIRGVAELLSKIINNSRVWRKFFKNVSPQLNGGFQNCTVMCYRVAVGTFGSAPVFWEVCLKKKKWTPLFGMKNRQ